VSHSAGDYCTRRGGVLKGGGRKWSAVKSGVTEQACRPLSKHWHLESGIKSSSLYPSVTLPTCQPSHCQSLFWVNACLPTSSLYRLVCRAAELRATASGQWWLSGDKREDYQNCSACCDVYGKYT